MRQFDFSKWLFQQRCYRPIDKNPAWFESYLCNRKRYIQIDENSKTNLKYVTCGVPKDLYFEHLCF